MQVGFPLPGGGMGRPRAGGLPRRIHRSRFCVDVAGRGDASLFSWTSTGHTDWSTDRSSRDPYFGPVSANTFKQGCGPAYGIEGRHRSQEHAVAIPGALANLHCLAGRRVQVAGITPRPDEAWMLQVARNLIDAETGALPAKRYLIIDRDTKYTQRFRHLIESSGTEVIRLPPLSPNLNAYAERFVRSIKDECLNRMIFVGQASLRHAVDEYMAHYHGEHNHQGLENRLLMETSTVAANGGVVQRRPRLGGMLNFYYAA